MPVPVMRESSKKERSRAEGERTAPPPAAPAGRSWMGSMFKSKAVASESGEKSAMAKVGKERERSSALPSDGSATPKTGWMKSVWQSSSRSLGLSSKPAGPSEAPINDTRNMSGDKDGLIDQLYRLPMVHQRTPKQVAAAMREFERNKEGRINNADLQVPYPSTSPLSAPLLTDSSG